MDDTSGHHVGGNMQELLPFGHPEFEAHRQLALDKNRPYLSSS